MINTEVNCKQLSNDVSVSWIVDESSKAIRIELCGCVPVSYVVDSWGQRNCYLFIMLQCWHLSIVLWQCIHSAFL